MSTVCAELCQQPVSCYFIFLDVSQSAERVRLNTDGKQSEPASGAEQYRGRDGAFTGGAAGIPTVVPAGVLQSLRARRQKGKGSKGEGAGLPSE